MKISHLSFIPIRSRFLVVFAFVSIFPGVESASAAVQACPSSMEIKPTVRVHKVLSDAKMVRNKTLGEINKMAANHKRMGEMVLGLTNAKSVVRVQIKMLFKNIRGGVCAVPKDILVKVGYTEQTVWIPKKYRTGSCEYQRVYRHEMDHVAARRIEINSRFPDVRHAIEKAGRKLSGAGQYKSTQIAQDDMIQFIAKVAESAMAKVNAAVDRRDKKIDDPRAVLKDQQRCRNW